MLNTLAVQMAAHGTHREAQGMPRENSSNRTKADCLLPRVALWHSTPSWAIVYAEKIRCAEMRQ